MFGGNKQIESLQSEVRRLDSALAALQEQYNHDVTVLRAQVARLAAGKAVSGEAIMNGEPFEEIHATEAHEKLKENPGWLILDVRTVEEWEGGRIADAIHIPIDELADRLTELPADKSQTILCVCAMGGRSAAACGILLEAGYSNPINMDGGMYNWPGEKVTG